jgi:predicted enzyme related to lactoylglutathione lyase
MTLPAAALSFPPSIRGTFFSISVSDVNAVSQWYQANLGLKVVTSGQAPNQVATFALLEGNGFIVEIIQPAVSNARTGRPFETQGIFKVGAVVDDLDGLLAALRELGVTIAYDLMPLPELAMRCFMLQDCAGNYLQFIGK